jgi:hypothetical protein
MSEAEAAEVGPFLFGLGFRDIARANARQREMRKLSLQAFRVLSFPSIILLGPIDAEDKIRSLPV